MHRSLSSVFRINNEQNGEKNLSGVLTTYCSENKINGKLGLEAILMMMTQNSIPKLD
jgi:hypothetical protein